MSEVSESVHLRSENAREAVELLRRAKVAGYVFPARNGWVSIVHAQADAESRFRVEEANKALLLFYDYVEEHGCWVNVRQGKKLVARLKASFGRPNATFDRAVFERLGLVSAAGGAAIEQWVRRAHVWHERTRASYVVAERLGLPRYRWFGYGSEREKAPGDSERIEVLADGTVRGPAKKKVAPHVAPPRPRPAKKGAAPKKKPAPKTAPKKTASKKTASRKTASKKTASKKRR